MVKQKDEQAVYQEENKPKNKAIFGWVFLLILLLLSFSLAVFSWYKTKNVSKPAPTDQKKQQEIFIDETANWKTYRNEEYGYEIKYPADWEKDYESVDKKVVSFANFPKDFVVSVVKDDLINYEQSLKNNLKPYNEEQIILNGTKFIKLSTIPSANDEPIQISFFINRNNNFYQIHGISNPQFEKILSTFKFIDQESVDSSDWKTYRNEEFGFEVKYPLSWPSFNGPGNKRVLYSIGMMTIKTDSILAKDKELSKDPEIWLDRIWESCREHACAPPPPKIIKRLTIEGHKAIKAISADIGGEEIKIYIGTNNGIYQMSFSFNTYDITPEELEKYEIVDRINYELYLDTMVSTFKFIDQESVDTSDWQTYRNEEYGFSLKLPKNWENYKVTEGNDTVNKDVKFFDFKLPHKSEGLNGVFIISIYPKKIWEERIKDEGPKPTYFDENDKYIFSYSLGHDDEGYVGFPDVKPNEIYKGPYYEFQHFILPTLSVDNSSWKTYINKDQGIEIQYPGSWEAKQDDNKIFIGAPYWRNDMPEGGGGLTISISDISLDDFIKNYNSSDIKEAQSIFKQEDYNIANIKAVKLTGTTALGVPKNFIFIKKNNKSYIIDYYDFDPIINKLLFTFKFIE